ncbi:MAG: rod shape-determining protein MreD [Firmicutes bacterium]|nr:rod shape-determining protein MreD [Bacillota bacterium]
MRYIIITITLIFNLILQSTLFEYISIIDVKPNSAIVIIISMAFMRGKTEGAVTGLIAGLLQDCFFAPYIGFYTFCYILVGYFCGMFFRGFYKETIITPLLLTAAFDLIFEFVYYVFNILLKGYVDFGFFLKSVILPEVVYTTLISAIIYKILYYINSLLEEREKFSQKLF